MLTPSLNFFHIHLSYFSDSEQYDANNDRPTDHVL